MSDTETQRQLDELREQLEAVRRTRSAARRRREALEEQAARLGNDAPPHVTTEITDLLVKQRELDSTIGEIEKRIARLSLAPQSAIEVLPHGDSVLPQLAPAVVDSRLQAVERTVERALDGIARISERLDIRDALDIERWRSQDTARRDGQHGYRWIFAGLALALLVLAVGVVLIAIKVY